MITFDEAMKLTSTVSSNAAFSDLECRTFWDLLNTLPATATVVEIGCQLGRTSSLILQAAKNRGFVPDFIDPWTEQPDYCRQWMVMAHSVGVPFRLHMMRTDQTEHIGQYGIDFLLIDGDHTAQGVKTDTTMMMGRMKRGGIVCAHDYGRDSLPDVWEQINIYLANRWQKNLWEPMVIADTLGVWRRSQFA